MCLLDDSVETIRTRYNSWFGWRMYNGWDGKRFAACRVRELHVRREHCSAVHRCTDCTGGEPMANRFVACHCLLWRRWRQLNLNTTLVCGLKPILNRWKWFVWSQTWPYTECRSNCALQSANLQGLHFHQPGTIRERNLGQRHNNEKQQPLQRREILTENKEEKQFKNLPPTRGTKIRADRCTEALLAKRKRCKRCQAYVNLADAALP